MHYLLCVYTLLNNRHVITHEGIGMKSQTAIKGIFGNTIYKQFGQNAYFCVLKKHLSRRRHRHSRARDERHWRIPAKLVCSTLR